LLTGLPFKIDAADAPKTHRIVTGLCRQSGFPVRENVAHPNRDGELDRALQ